MTWFRCMSGIAVSLQAAMWSVRWRTQLTPRDAHVDPMLLSIVGEKQEIAVLHDAIDEHADGARYVSILNGMAPKCDLIDGLAVPIAQRAAAPIRRQAWRKSKAVSLEPESQQRLQDKSINPARRTSVPTPARAD